MSRNSKAEIFKKLRMGKACHFFKNYVSIDKKKYVFLILFAWKMRDYQGFSWNKETQEKPHHKWQILGLIVRKIRALRLC